LLRDGEYIDNSWFDELFVDADELAKMLFSVLKSTGRVDSNKSNKSNKSN